MAMWRVCVFKRIYEFRWKLLGYHLVPKPLMLGIKAQNKCYYESNKIYRFVRCKRKEFVHMILKREMLHQYIHNWSLFSSHSSGVGIRFAVLSLFHTGVISIDKEGALQIHLIFSGSVLCESISRIFECTSSSYIQYKVLHTKVAQLGLSLSHN